MWSVRVHRIEWFIGRCLDIRCREVRYAACCLLRPNQLFRRTGNLERYIHEKTGVEEDAVLAYLSDGRRLQSENVRDLAGVEDQVRALRYSPRICVLTYPQTIYVFNKTYLDLDMEVVLRQLRLEPPLQPPVEGT